MIFNSVTFLLFLVVVTVCYWNLPPRPRYWFLFLASTLFYAFWRWEYLGVLLLSAGVDYIAARRIESVPSDRFALRKGWLALSLIVNLGTLMYFKYLIFFSDNFNALLGTIGSTTRLPHWEIILPFGISFYTFETISYTIDVYRGHIRAERKFLNYGLFIAFFPKLVAGPIQRASELIVQLKERPGFQLLFLSEGMERILHGLFLKVILADNIAPLVDEGFAADPITLGGVDVITLAFLFGFQIYFDFSAYSHIALGAARVLGIELPENFNFPYAARSMKEFWKRWHISLSSWIRDYLYLPLTGTSVRSSTGRGGIGQSLGEEASQRRKNFALFSTWAIMGFWHGANWTFVAWGLYHAAFIFLERKLTPIGKIFPSLKAVWLTWPVTITVAMLGWIPFRAKTLGDALSMFRQLVSAETILTMSLRENTYLVTALMLLAFLVSWYFSTLITPQLAKRTVLFSVMKFPFYATIIFFVLVFLRPINQFIYFQF